MAKNNLDVLNDLYKELEKAIRENVDIDTSVAGGPVAYYESTLPKEDLRTVVLRYLRTTRNTYTHNPGMDKYISITDESIKMLKSIIADVESLNGTVKDRYCTLAKIKAVDIATATLMDVCNVHHIGNSEYVFAVSADKQSIKYITSDDIIAAAVKGTSLKTGKVKNMECSYSFTIEDAVDITTPLKRVSDHDIPLPVVKSGKIVGILY